MYVCVYCPQLSSHAQCFKDRPHIPSNLTRIKQLQKMNQSINELINYSLSLSLSLSVNLGSCDGNSQNDMILPNGTVVADDEDPAVFIDSWQIPDTTSYISQSRRRKVNCSTSNCSECLNMLNNLTFTVCHSYVCNKPF